MRGPVHPQGQAMGAFLVANQHVNMIIEVLTWESRHLSDKVAYARENQICVPLLLAGDSDGCNRRIWIHS